jgi:hypothetical protein
MNIHAAHVEHEALGGSSPGRSLRARRAAFCTVIAMCWLSVSGELEWAVCARE